MTNVGAPLWPQPKMLSLLLAVGGAACAAATRPDGHHRLRVLAEVPRPTSVTCSKAYIAQQTDRINVECCDEPTEHCSGGNIGTCNEGCAALVNPLWDACQTKLGPAAAVLATAADRCGAHPPPVEAGGSRSSPGEGTPTNAQGAPPVRATVCTSGLAGCSMRAATRVPGPVRGSCLLRRVASSLGVTPRQGVSRPSAPLITPDDHPAPHTLQGCSRTISRS
jgi:hypothetical protein